MRSLNDLAIGYGQRVEALLEWLGARIRQARTPGEQSAASQKERTPQDTPPPVYRIWERSGAYEVWVGPAGVWVGAETREALEQARLEVEARLATRFPWLTVRAGLREQRWQREQLAARIRYGQQRLSPEEVYAVTRLLSKPVQAEGSTKKQPGTVTTPNVRAPRMRTVRLEGIPAVFYVGPVGVLAVAEYRFIAETEAKRVWEDSGGTISALPVVLDPRLKEPQGRVGGVLALRDEAAIRQYLRGKHLLDEDEVVQIAGWLGNRQAPVPQIRDKAGRYRFQGEVLAEARLEAPPAFGVELVPPGPPPNPLMLRLASLLGTLRR